MNSSRQKPQSTEIDYSGSTPVPAWVRDVIEAHLAIEAEDARSAGNVGFLARALVLATMPYKDPKTDVFKRVNGNFSLRIIAGYEGGIPYGIYPRLLMSWTATEAVRKQSPVIELGDSLRLFLRDVLDLRSTGGGTRGSSTRVTEQMKRLYGSMITAQYTGDDKQRFRLKNVVIAQDLELDKRTEDSLNALAADNEKNGIWTPQKVHEAGAWQSKLILTENFFQECITNPVPIDLRAYKALRGSPLAMDVYSWLTYRMSYTQARTKPIRWEALMMQFGSNFTSEQAVRDFKKAFLKALKMVQVVYPQATVCVADQGLILFPSPTHVPRIGKQGDLFS